MSLEVTVILLAALVLVAALYVLAWRRRLRREALPTTTEGDAVDQTTWDRRFALAMQRIDHGSLSRAHRYELPWCLVVGEQGSGRSTALASAELHRPFGTPGRAEIADRSFCFWLFGEGVAIETPGLDPDADAPTVAAEPLWRRLLGSIRRARRRRPIDSILLTIPAPSLFGAQEWASSPRSRRAEMLAQNIRQIQQEIGVRCPVYVLLTKCDQITGFQGFRRTVPQALQGDMFGWSTPYDIDTPYRSEWVDEAFAALDQTLGQLQLEILTTRDCAPHDRVDLLLFPAELAKLAEPLRVYFDHLFRPNGYFEALPLRGIYLAGAETEADPQAVPTAAFTTHLLGRKIFSERSLAQPGARSRMFNERILLGLRILVAIVACASPFALWSGAARLEREIEPTERAFQEIHARLDQARDMQGVSKVQIGTHVVMTLDSMSEVSVESLRLLRLPTSYFSPIEEEVRHGMTVAFERIVLHGFYLGLGWHHESLLRTPLAQDPGAERPLAPEHLLAFKRLLSLDGDLARFAEHVDLYNGLEDSPAATGEWHTAITTLASYLFEVELSANLFRSSGLYGEALEKAMLRRFDERAVSVDGHLRATELARELKKHAFDLNPIDVNLAIIQTELRDLPGLARDEDAGLARLRRLSAALAQVSRDLEDPESAWIHGGELAPGFGRLTDAVRTSSLLGPPLADDFATLWRDGLVQLHDRIHARRGPTGPLLTAGEQKHVLTPEVTAIGAIVDAVLAQSYLRSEAPGESVETQHGTLRVHWNDSALNRALQYCDGFDILDKTLTDAPADMRTGLRASALYHLERGVRAAVQHGHQTEFYRGPETGDAARSELAADIAEFSRSQASLQRLLAADDRLELHRAGDELRALLIHHGDSLLHRLDQLLFEDEPYVASEALRRWDGSVPPAYVAFGVHDATGLGQYLKVQKERISDLAGTYAAQPVASLEGVHVGARRPPSPRFLRWQRILVELERDKAMAPDNSVKVLERFITEEMNTVTLDNCVDVLAGRFAPASDYFLVRYEELREQLLGRCEERLAAGLDVAFADLARLFNDTLAGRYPFATHAVSGRSEADPADIRGFYRQFAPFLGEYLEYARVQPERLRKDSAAFVKAMQAVGGFAAPIVSDTTGSPAYDLTAEYRVARGSEQHANQIIEWTLDVNGRPAGGTEVQWHPGEPLRMHLRWAKDGPMLPCPDGQDPGVEVHGESVSYDFDGTWALVRLLRGHLARAETDPRPHTLKFSVRLAERPVAGAKLRCKRDARALIRVIVSPPGSKTRLTAPRVWPTKAPTSGLLRSASDEPVEVATP